MYNIKSIRFEGSFTAVEQIPIRDLPEFAFIGRSNVGKSSLINYLLDRKGVARVSKKPGKTRQLNYFLIDELWRLVDLPGYGYAVSSKSEIVQWDKMVRSFFLNRNNLRCVFVLIDGNIEPQPNDFSYIGWLGDQGLPISLVFTKSDKSKPKKYGNQIEQFKQKFLEEWEALPPCFVTSSEAREGRENMMEFIHSLIEE